MRQLWFNADDFGLSAGVCEGIAEAMNLGVVGTTSAMVARTGSLALIERHAAAIRARMGLHLQLTDGRPVLPARQVPSLVDDSGRFPDSRQRVGQPDPDEVYREWSAQLAALREAGVEPSHIDSHHHVHALPGVSDAYIRLARQHRLPARGATPRLGRQLRQAGVATADRFTSRFYGERVDQDALFDVLTRAGRNLADGQWLEVMCHPGRPDGELVAASDYVDGRLTELETLCQPDLEARLEALDFAVCRHPPANGVNGG